MSRHFTHDSRSPTIGQTPSRNMPVRSTEAPATSLSMAHLLDGLKMQMLNDREEQDILLKTFEQVLVNVNYIRKRQDDYWTRIQQALRAAEGTQEDDDENESQESRTQAWAYPGGDDDGFRAISEAEDSALGQPTQQEDGFNGRSGEQQVGSTRLQSTVRSAVSIARATTYEDRTRGSTELQAEYILDNLADGFVLDDGKDAQTDREVMRPGTVSASRMPTPLTPGVNKRAGLGHEQATTTTPMEGLDLTNVVSSPSSPPDPQTPIARPTGTRTMRPPPRKTPVTKGKRKRTAEKDFVPSTSAEPRPKRMAASSAEKRNQNFFEFGRMSRREQSQVLSDELRSPFYSCGDCRKATCTRCEERRVLGEYSSAMRLK